LVEKFPTVWEKLPQVLRGGDFLAHTVQSQWEIRLGNVDCQNISYKSIGDTYMQITCRQSLPDSQNCNVAIPRRRRNRHDTKLVRPGNGSPSATNVVLLLRKCQRAFQPMVDILRTRCELGGHAKYCITSSKLQII